MWSHLILVTLPDKVEPIEVDLPCLIPFEVCHAVYNQGPETFRHSMLGEFGDTGVVDFWKHASKETWAVEHPVVQMYKETPDVLTPLTWHLDGAEMQRNSEYYILNCGSLLAQASETHSLDARFMAMAIPHVIMKLPGVKKQAMKLMSSFVKWNHKVFKSGKMPSRGFYNEKYAKNSRRFKNAGLRIMGKYVGVFVGLKADGKARVPIVPKTKLWFYRI